jgi:Ser/Thr protein kinase RdoA (MazF antagonist)
MKNLNEIAAKWGAIGSVELVAERENTVYRIMRTDAPAALRLHRAGYQNEASILSELQWTKRLAEAGFPCPKPIAKSDGTFTWESSILGEVLGKSCPFSQ